MSYQSRQRAIRRKRFPRCQAALALAALVVSSLSPYISSWLSSAAENLPSLKKEEEYQASNDTLIFDGSPAHNLLAVLHAGESRMIMTPEQIPAAMKQAIVVIEDDRFYEHRGVDPLGMARALFTNFSEARLAEGGSTITQQYIKNTYVSNEPSLQRKLKEAIYAYELEQKWPKDRIVSEYLNTIYFGHGAYGLQVAAITFFNKPASQLTVAECALLAALPKSPIQFSPSDYPEAAQGRRNLVLAKMLNHGMINQEEYEAALATPLPSQRYNVGPETSHAPYFVEYVKQQLIAKYGTKTVFEGGLRVYTSLELSMQTAAEKAVASVLDQPTDPGSALVSLDPKSGQVKAMVGGRSFAEQKFNVAVQGHRQPGSSFKPFVLATALAKGIPPSQTFVSEPKHIFLGGSNSYWDVGNFDSLYLGKIDLTKATVYSDNAVYADLMMKVGPEAVSEMAHKAGVKSVFSATPAIALGGLDNGVNPLEMALAYSTFANGGKKVVGSVDFEGDGPDPISILKVTDSQDRVLDENQPVSSDAIDPIVAYHVNNVLKQVAMNGTGKWSNLGRPCAGKSGTTEDHVDAWFSGYTPDLVTSVWIGYTGERVPMLDVRGSRVTGGAWPAQIWNLYMSEALAGVAANDFIKPPNADLVKAKVCSESGQLPLPWCPTTEERGFLPGFLPKEKCTLHQPHEVVVPSVTGKKLADAYKELRALGLEVNLSFKNDKSLPADQVVDQQPKVGSKIMQGAAKVTLVVAGPPGSLQLPAEETSAPEGQT